MTPLTNNLRGGTKGVFEASRKLGLSKILSQFHLLGARKGAISKKLPTEQVTFLSTSNLANATLGNAPRRAQNTPENDPFWFNKNRPERFNQSGTYLSRSGRVSLRLQCGGGCAEMPTKMYTPGSFIPSSAELSIKIPS